jgi:hypothetical protein
MNEETDGWRGDPVPATDLAPARHPRRLLSRARLEFLRGPIGGGRMLSAEECRELAEAYETATRLLEEIVRARGAPRPDGLVTASDVAWLALREAER